MFEIVKFPINLFSNLNKTIDFTSFFFFGMKSEKSYYYLQKRIYSHNDRNPYTSVKEWTQKI